MRPLAIFGVIIVVGLIAIEAGLRVTDHPANATPLPTRLTHAQFVRSGNAVCSGYNREGKAIFKTKPKTLKMVTRDLRLWMPLVERDVAGLRALVPPVRDDGTYRSLLGVMGQENYDARAVLHAFETGQYRRGVLVARHMDHLDTHFNSLSRQLGLTACGQTAEQAGSGSARKASGAAVTHSGTAKKSGAAPAPRPAGRYATVTEVVSVFHNGTRYPGETTHRTWTFIPRCVSGGCVIALLLPSNTPGSRRIYSYTLRRIGGNRYRGERADPDSCQVVNPNGQVSVLPNSFMDYGTITVRVTQTSGGRVTAFDGTFLWRAVPQASARAHGCTVTGRVTEIFRGVKK